MDLCQQSNVSAFYEKWYRWTFLYGRNRDAAVENRHAVTGRDREAGTNLESSIDIYTLCVCVCVCVCVFVQSVSHVQLFETPWTAAYQASLSFTISWSLLKFMSVESVMLPNDHIFCHPLLLLPSILPSIRVFSSESALRIRWPKY